MSRKERRRMELERIESDKVDSEITPERVNDEYTKRSVEELIQEMAEGISTEVPQEGTVETSEVKKAVGRPRKMEKIPPVREVIIRLNNCKQPWAIVRTSKGCRWVHQEIQVRLTDAKMINEKTTIVCTYADSDRAYDPKGKKNLELPSTERISWEGLEQMVLPLDVSTV